MSTKPLNVVFKGRVLGSMFSVGLCVFTRIWRDVVVDAWVVGCAFISQEERRKKKNRPSKGKYVNPTSAKCHPMLDGNSLAEMF